MRKTFSAEYENLSSGDGVLDIAIRFDTKTGDYEYVTEENGLPVTVPAHVFVGILGLLAFK